MNENVNVMNEVAEVTTDVEQGLIGVGIGQLMNAGASADLYCSIKADTFESKASVYNAINAPDKKLSECINMIINVSDVVAHEVTLIDNETGEVTKALRTILVDTNGVTYQAVSVGVANSLQRIFSIFGEPATWKNPLKVKPVQKTTNNGTNKVTLLEVVK